MNLKSILLAVAALILCGLAGFAYWAARRGAMPPPGYPQIKGWTGGHHQKWERLPFEISRPTDLPVARTPDRSPLTIAMISGQYLNLIGTGGSHITIDPNGTCTSGSGGCLDSGTAQGLARIVDGRVEIESLSLWGNQTGDKCYCVPVWFKGHVYLLGPPGHDYPGGVLQFCNAVNWGEEPREKYDRSNLEYLFVCDATKPGTEPVTSVPDEIEKYILREPLEGKLVEVASGDARVNLGSKQGVFVGQRLFAKPEEGYGTWLRVLSVEEERCVVGSYFSLRSGDLPPAGTPVRCEANAADALGQK